MRKFILSLSACLLCLACLTACQDNADDIEDNGEYTPPAHATRTVLVYIAGENNLTSSGGYRFLHDDLQEIIKGSKLLTDDQRLFVFVDSLNTNKQAAGTPYIIEVPGGKSYMRHEYEQDFYSCDPARFQEIIQRVVAMAPSDSYGLVLWGHASGWAVTTDQIDAARRITRAYGRDDGKDGGEQDKGQRWMNITQMAKALEEVPKLEFIFADCCNMMCAEVGYELREATNYLIGSPAEIPGNGAPYNMIIPHLYKEGDGLYRGIIDTYFDDYTRAYQYDWGLKGHSVPLSVIDTRHIEQLAEETAKVLDKFSDGYPHYPAYPNLTTDSVAFYWYYDTPIMYDMRAFIKTYVGDEDFEQWDKAYQEAVPYYRMSLKWMTIYDNLNYAFRTFSRDMSCYGCVSMFIPKNTSIYFNGTFKYNKTYNDYGWNRVIDWSRFGWTDDVTYQ